MKKIFFHTILFISLISTLLFPTTFYANQLVTANLNPAKFLIGGVELIIPAYNIDGHNYFRIRDLCKILDFNVEWNNDAQSVSILSSQTYDYSIVEQVFPRRERVNVNVSKIHIYMNFTKESVNSFNIDGYNYFMLKDLADLSQLSIKPSTTAPYFTIDWDSQRGLIVTKVIKNKESINPKSEFIKQSKSDENPNYKLDEYTAEVIRLVNIERGKVGLPPVESNLLLMDIAQLKAEEMAELNYFSHTSPSYGNIIEFAEHYGYIDFSYISENIYYSKNIFTNAEGAVKWWVNSEPHYNNIIKDGIDNIGVGIAQAGDAFYAVQLFSISFFE